MGVKKIKITTWKKKRMMMMKILLKRKKGFNKSRLDLISRMQNLCSVEYRLKVICCSSIIITKEIYGFIFIKMYIRIILHTHADTEGSSLDKINPRTREEVDE